MTAQIAIMNKEAVALASDSAVTVGGETGQKIFTSANKVFALSKYRPVGIMIYGDALLMDVPWETIIKIYRDNLGKNKFETLKEYATDFVAFLDNGNSLFPESVQEEYVRGSIYAYFRFMQKAITEAVQRTIEEEGEIDDKSVARIASAVIEEHYQSWEEADCVPSLPDDFVRDTAVKYGASIRDAIKEVFEELPISRRSLSRLKRIASNLFCKFPKHVQIGLSGVVVAGFGEKDVFPSLQAFDVEGIANNRLKYREGMSGRIDSETSASIIPFAQGEMVATFMEGIDPYLQSHIQGYLSEVFDKYPEIIVESIEKFDDNEKRLMKANLKKASDSIFKDYQEHVEGYRRNNYVEPVVNVVAMLPKDELAAMAEALVNLTSFKRKVTMELETVGGPIDVAVISKGDGFIWIKRKHYFRAELNPQFFANYYREV